MTSSGTFPLDSKHRPAPTRSEPSLFMLRNFTRLTRWVTSKMGNLTSTNSRVPNEDRADQDLSFPTDNTWDQMLRRCRRELENLPPIVARTFLNCPLATGQHSVCGQNSTDYNLETQLTSNENSVKVMQWNILSQALGEMNDNFVACPDEALSWTTRRWRLLEEIVSCRPDVLCLQEVDHFRFLEMTLGSLGFQGVFCPKPDSPCLYVDGNNGPDGCAIFWNESEFELVESRNRTLQVWGCETNQVALMVVLRRKESQNQAKPVQMCVVTTHLKARQGTFLSALRHEQGKDLLQWVRANSPPDGPLVVAGDFNAEPCEPVYKAVLSDDLLQLDSSYAAQSDDFRNGNGHGIEPPYTTWKIREEGEVCHTIDYIFYSRKHLTPCRILGLPNAEQIGPQRVPSFGYPSDHFSMVAEFRFLDINNEEQNLT